MAYKQTSLTNISLIVRVKSSTVMPTKPNCWLEIMLKSAVSSSGNYSDTFRKPKTEIEANTGLLSAELRGAILLFI